MIAMSVHFIYFGAYIYMLCVTKTNGLWIYLGFMAGLIPVIGLIHFLEEITKGLL